MIKDEVAKMRIEFRLLKSNKTYRRAFLSVFIIVPLFSILFINLLVGMFRLSQYVIYNKYLFFYYVIGYGFMILFIYIIDRDKIHKDLIVMKYLEQKFIDGELS